MHGFGLACNLCANQGRTVNFCRALTLARSLVQANGAVFRPREARSSWCQHAMHPPPVYPTPHRCRVSVPWTSPVPHAPHPEGVKGSARRSSAGPLHRLREARCRNRTKVAGQNNDSRFRKPFDEALADQDTRAAVMPVRSTMCSTHMER